MKTKFILLSLLLFTFNNAFCIIVSLTRSTCSKGPNGYEYVNWTQDDIVNAEGKVYRVNQFINCHEPGNNNCPVSYPGRPLEIGNSGEVSDVAVPSINDAIENMIINANNEVEGNGIMTGSENLHLMEPGDQDYLITLTWNAHYNENNCLIEGYTVEIVPYP